MTITVGTPDGGTAYFPDGTDPNVISSALRTKFGGDPQKQAFNAGSESGAQDNPLQAAATQFAQQASFGLSNYITAGARYMGQRLTGVKRPDTFATDVAFARGNSAGDQGANPVAGTLGGIAGGVAGGGLLGKALTGLRAAVTGSRFASPNAAAVLDALVPKAGQPVRNVVKSAGANAAIGATTAAVNQNPTDSADLLNGLPVDAQTGLVSSVVGPVAGKVATSALSAFEPVAQKAMIALANHLGESPEDLAATYTVKKNLTGALPAMVDLLNYKSQGLIKKLAAANNVIGTAARIASDAGQAPAHEQLAALDASNAVPGRSTADQTAAMLGADVTWPQSPAGVNNLRDSTTDDAMAAPHKVTGVALKDTHAPDPKGILLAPHVALALRPNTAMEARLNIPDGILDRIRDNQQTIGDIDTVRRALRQQQSALLRPTAGGIYTKDPIRAKEFGSIADQVEQLGVRADSDYGKVLQNYRGLSNYSDGFAHGLAGNGLAERVDPGDTLLASALGTDMGKAGHAHGNALYIMKAARDAIAPPTINPQQSGITPHAAANVGMAIASGPVGAAYHAMQAFAGLRAPHLSDGAQKQIADMLTNPKLFQQGINNLKRAGARDEDIRTMGAAIGGVAGQRMANFISAQPQGQ